MPLLNIENMMNAINENEYIVKCKSNKKKDFCSLSYLIDKQLSQSDCIKLGIGVEKVTLQTILNHTGLADIKPKNTKNSKEKDHLFCDEQNKIIYYAELKANINLDTEKSKSTYNKCLQIVSELQATYPDYQIKWCLLGYRFKHYDEIPRAIKKKYAPIASNLYGINQYFDMLNVDFNFSDETYKTYLNHLASKMFDE